MKITRVIAIAMLIFLGAGAFIGGIPLVLDPSGRLMHLPHRFLDTTPFSSFLIPGILLFAANGVMSFVALAVVMRRLRLAGLWVVMQGCISLGWIVGEMILLRVAAWPQWLYVGVSVILLVSGWRMHMETRQSVHP